MTTMVQKPKRRSVAIPTVSPADQLRTTMAAVRLSFVWFGTRKTLTPAQKAEAADTFGAEGEFLSAGKKLVDTRHPKFKAVTAVRSRAVSYWRAVSLPYPDPGIRLIRQDRVDAFNTNLLEFHSELLQSVRELDQHFDALKTAAQERLGRLFNAADYPNSLEGLFDVSWEFPSVEPPEYLRDLKPEIYHQECRRVQARFDEAVRLAEAAFIEELSKLVSHLGERLDGSEDGQPKVFRDSAVSNLQAFFERFRQLNVGSNVQLDELVNQCQRIVRGVQPQQLRENESLRQRVAGELSSVGTVLDGLLVDRPRRKLLRIPR